MCFVFVELKLLEQEDELPKMPAIVHSFRNQEPWTTKRKMILVVMVVLSSSRRRRRRSSNTSTSY